MAAPQDPSSLPPPLPPSGAPLPARPCPSSAAIAPLFLEPSPPTASPPEDSGIPLVIVDGANVVGSVPDGWWRDRPGAAARLRDSLATVPVTGLPGIAAPVVVILVVEGRARTLAQGPAGVRIERASGSGDDTIVDLVRGTPATRRIIVVTADRGLRDRVTALGAEVRGPSAVRRRPPA